ncbi:MAG: cell division protein FtsQ/DivIB [Candidatus Fervidibacter sp.]|uniref:cell division protein FtsQ/DivIB n=1 Tax=Candidatus Fervidibacter sp. TaxID=3100871 RepID=UPI00404997E0
MKRNWLKLVLVASAIFLAVKGLAVRQVVWEGDAPIGFDKIVAVNEKLLGRPIWLITERQIRRYLEGELVDQVEIKRKLPSTLVIVAEPPKLVGVVPKGFIGVVLDECGRNCAKVPLFATRLPFLMLPENVSARKCIPAVNRIMNLCAQEGVPIRAIWLSQHGEAAIYLSEGFWLKLGNPAALELKLELGKLLRRNKLIPPGSVADLSVPSIVSLWEIERSGEQRR